MTTIQDHISQLGHEDLDEAVAVLTLAFGADPLMRTLFPDETGKCTNALMRFACQVRLCLSWPLLGFLEDGKILGIIGLSEGMDVSWPEELHGHYETLKQHIGLDATIQLESYSDLVDGHRPQDHHIFVGVLGVDPEKQGLGIGRALLDAAYKYSNEKPASTGVFLDTENPRNVSFYQHMGYRIIHEGFLDDLRIWCLFRPNS